MSKVGKEPETHKFNNVEESSSSEDDEDAELLTEEFEENFFKVLSHLKKKDEKIYNEEFSFFPVNDAEESDVQTCKSQNKGNEGKKSETDYKTWLKGQKNRVEDDVKEDLEGLHEFWANPKLNKSEKFLRDYILNKKFLDADQSFNVEEEIERLSEEEKEIQEEIEFEHNYNYRFENENEDLVEQFTNTSKKELKKKIYDANMQHGKQIKDKLKLKHKKKLWNEIEGTNPTENKNHVSPEVNLSQVVKERGEFNGVEKIDETSVNKDRVGFLEVKEKRNVTKMNDLSDEERRKEHSSNASKGNALNKNVELTSSFKKMESSDAAVELSDKNCIKEQIHTSVEKHDKRKKFRETDGQLGNEKKIKIMATGIEEKQTRTKFDVIVDTGLNIAKAKCESNAITVGVKKRRQKLKKKLSKIGLVQEKNKIKHGKINKNRHMNFKRTRNKNNLDPETIKGLKKELLCRTVCEFPKLERKKQVKCMESLRKKLQMHNPENGLDKSFKMKKERWSNEKRKIRKQNVVEGTEKATKKKILKNRKQHFDPSKYKPLQNKQLSTTQGGVKKRKERKRRVLQKAKASV